MLPIYILIISIKTLLTPLFSSNLYDLKWILRFNKYYYIVLIGY